MLISIQKYLINFFQLFYPSICCGCGNHLYDGEDGICVGCRMSLPYTFDEYRWKNKTFNVFLGRVKIKAASSYLYFRKKSRVQSILHYLKYKNHQELGHILGSQHAHQLVISPFFYSIDMVMPVPMHKDKLKSRGYNQAELLARAYAEVFKIECRTDLLIRKINSHTQTKKSRYARYENMLEVFECVNPEDIVGKRILLVDDVITTGSTIEACAEVLIKHECKGVFVASIAIA